MSRFRFGLERVLRLRRSQEELARAAVAGAAAAEDRRAAEARSRGEELDRAGNDLRLRPGGLLGAAELRARHLYRERAGRELLLAQADLGQAQAARAEATAAARRAWAAARCLQLLCDRCHQAWRRDQARREGRAIDDRTAAAWERRTNE